MSEKKVGVVISHGDHALFVSKETIKKACAFICSGCGNLIHLSTFGSTIGQQLLRHCEEMTEEQIQKRINR